jgi:hypothetical protein
MQTDPRQATATVLMIRPLGFGFNPETAATNVFQHQPIDDSAAIRTQAIAEFDQAVQQLRGNDVDVLVFDDTLTPHTPDAVFPNNWISTHSDGRLLLYPMLAPSRQAEVRMDIVEQLQTRFGFNQVIDLREPAKLGGILEGTGSAVLDRVHGVIYAALSERTSARAVEQLAKHLGYRSVLFNATDANGIALYHTNVMLCLGDRFAVVCLESVDEVSRATLRNSLESTGHDVIAISREQMLNFAGNMLQLRSQAGESQLVLSASARASLNPAQVQILERHSRLLPIALPTIERHGGGSIRCMIAEIFPPLH